MKNLFKRFDAWFNGPRIPKPSEFCHLCRGDGKMPGEYWNLEQCTWCLGTGRPPVRHDCGCHSVNGVITSCYYGHGHVSGGPENLDPLSRELEEMFG